MSETTTAAPQKQAWHVGRSEDIPEHGRMVVDAGDKTVGVFRVGGDLVAYENRCAHMGGPICQGLIVPRVYEQFDDAGRPVGNAFDESDMHIACPWHGYEYSLKTGRHAGKKSIGLRPVTVEETDEGEVYVHI
ncbi:Rieske (2Fe-2S) domain-containing protein [Salinisphaera dokdonensis CL-ES53]|uniref:Rieske (2Fe-2S) domain-containing protein n=1 Tax=Salinisphaera dokdonensis CL-ES53 TaxID=1304272 RepID=A0ABV2AZA8_9GAMM